MELGLSGRTALVCGASAGLGYAAAYELAREGAEVVINSRDQSRLDEAALKIEKNTGNRPLALAADISTQNGIEQLMAGLFGESKSIDILVSNTGGPPPGQFLDQTQQDFDTAAGLLLDSAVSLTRLLMPSMISRKWGRLIYITSIAVLQPVNTLILSNTYRAAVTGFCKTISNNYACEGITANCVCPGYTKTERLQSLAENLARSTGQSAEAVMEGFGSGTPSGRIGQPEELAALIAFLASERAGYITGSSIAVDGGLNKALV